MFGSGASNQSENLSLTTAKTQELAGLFLAKLDEQIERLSGIVRRLPREQSRWTPDFPRVSFPQPKALGEVLGHLLQCLAGFVAVLHAVHPEELGHFLELKKLPVNHLCERDEALERIEEYRRHIREGFQLLQDGELGRVLPTVFAPEGEAVLTLLLGNLEHLINHKHEVFYYGKLLEIPLTSPDLYLFRTHPGSSRNSERKELTDEDDA